MIKLTGWSSSYYQLPEGSTELQDLIEYRGMNFAIGNIFKATYRLGHKQGTSAIYDLEKIIWYAQREMARLEELHSDVVKHSQPGAHMFEQGLPGYPMAGDWKVTRNSE